jgi:glycosyltransferase involved in cell wall biosynthesis
LIAALYGRDGGSLPAEVVKIRTSEDKSREKEYADVAARSELDHRRRLREDLAVALCTAAERTVLDLHQAQPFDLIYERYSLFSAAGVRASSALGIPCFVEVNAPLVAEQRQFRKLMQVDVAEAIEAEVFQGADALLAVSEPVRDYMLAKGAAAEGTHVIPNGADVTRFHPGVEARRPRIPGAKFVVGFSGSLKPWHGIEMLLDAFRLLARRSPDYHLLIVGDGPLRDWVRGYVRGAELEAAVTCTGWVGHEQLPGLLRGMEVTVAPYPAMEGFYFSPLKLYEYMAVGAPVVASDVSEIARIIRHEETGLLIEPGDPAALADQIERLRADPLLRARIGAEAARKAREFTWESNALQVTDLARRAVASCPDAGIGLNREG